MNDKKKNYQRQASLAVRNLHILSNGSQLYKLKANGKLHKRTFRMDKDYLTLRQINTKKFFRKMIGIDTSIPSISLNEIQDVREGAYTDTFIKHFEELDVKQDQCLSIIYGSKQRSFDIVADNKDLRDSWFYGLRHLMKKYKQADLITQQDIWMREIFKKADKNNDGVLSLKEIIALLKSLNVEINYDNSEEAFKDANVNKELNPKGEEVLDLDEFIRFYQVMTLRPEIEEIFENFNFEGKYLTPDELHRFLTEEQKMDVDIEECKKLIENFEPVIEIRNQHMLGRDGFNALINSACSSIFNINHANVYQDMTQPLSNYWIDSSHNTYLIADQLVGNSRVEAYINALRMGCRCVELDVWDGPSGEPIVYHGHTLTSKINYKDVISCVNLYAFEASEYPVILSLENHCSVSQQKKMAHYLHTILGDKLFITADDDLLELPSPEALKGKILVKGKHLHFISDDGGDVSDEDEAADIENDNEEVKIEKPKKKGEKVKLAKELSDLAILCQSVAFKGFEHASNNYSCNQMSSFGESKASSLASDHPSEYIQHNTKFLSRIYPGGTRTDSSNYFPMEYWNTGCQIVALNYQTPDEPMLLYRGRFRDNGGCGYILKPPFLRNQSTEGTFIPKGPYPLDWKRKLIIKVISAYQLPKKKNDAEKSILDPYVKIEIKGVEMDEQSHKTEFIKNNGFNPQWNEVKEFVVNVPDLAVIAFYVHDYEPYKSNAMVAQYCLPFNSLREGFRSVPLCTKKGIQIFGCSLFLHISISKT